MKPKNLILPLLLLLGMLVGLYMIFFYAPIEREIGVVQKIFYFHLPSALAAFFGFLLVFIYSLLYLRTHNLRWDRLAAAAAEVGLIFCTLVLITGPIWAKPVWGIWWTWDARLTLTLVLWLIYVAYVMLRHYVTEPTRRAAVSAVVGIIGFVDVPLVYFAIRWWRTQHPQPVIAGGEDSGLDPAMSATLYVCAIVFLLLFIYLMNRRATVERLQNETDELYRRLDERSAGAGQEVGP